MRKLIEQIMKFSVVGVIAFVIDYGLLALLTEVFGVNYLVSATISFIVSVVFNYLASMRYVFKHKEGMSRRREFVIFVTLSVIGLLINNGLMWAGVELIPWPGWLRERAYLIVKIFATAVVMVWNFVTRKKFLDAGDAVDVENTNSANDARVAGSASNARPAGSANDARAAGRASGSESTAARER